MGKPSRKQLLEDDDFEEAHVRVKCWRRKSDGNLYFISDTNGKVYDKYIQIQDQAGIPVVTHRKQKGAGLGGRLLRLGALVLSSQAGIPGGVAKALLRRSRESDSGAVLVNDMAELIKQKKPRDAVLKLVDATGAEEAKETIDSYSEDGAVPWTWARFFDAVSSS